MPDRLINSTRHGSIITIPREGGYLVRFYIALDEVRDRDMLAARSVTPEQLTEIANRILHPYRADVRDVGWCSMLSMAEAFNLGWKLASVLCGTARPELLHTYSAERQAIAAESIEFHRKWSHMVSAPRQPARTAVTASTPTSCSATSSPQGRFTAGVATRYEPSMITAEPQFQHLWPPAFWWGCGSTQHRSSVWPMPSRCGSGTSPAPMAPGGCTRSATTATRRPTPPRRGSCSPFWSRTPHPSRGSRRRAPIPNRR